MAAKQVIVDISPAGTVAIEAVGFNGVGCAKATQTIEIALGGTGGTKQKKKPEYFTPTGQNNQNKQCF